MYRLVVEPVAENDLRKIDASNRVRIAAAIDDLATEPRPPGVVKLKGMDAWRIRVGACRVIYEIRDEVLLVLVIRVAHRREAYR